MIDSLKRLLGVRTPRNKSKHRTWARRVKKRCKGRCVITKSRLNLHAHHLNDSSNFPRIRYDVTNGVMLTAKLHRMFHIEYMGGYDKKCTSADFSAFLVWYQRNYRPISTFSIIRRLLKGAFRKR